MITAVPCFSTESEMVLLMTNCQGTGVSVIPMLLSSKVELYVDLVYLFKSAPVVMCSYAPCRV